jgi:hypothetical protein
VADRDRGAEHRGGVLAHRVLVLEEWDLAPRGTSIPLPTRRSD